MPHDQIAGEDVVLSCDFVKDVGRDVLTNQGNLDLMIRILKSPSTYRIVVVAHKDLRKVRLEEIVIGNDPIKVSSVITSQSFIRPLGLALGVDVERIGAHLKGQFVPIWEKYVDRLRNGSEPSREELDRQKAWGETPTQPVVVFSQGEYRPLQ